MINPLDNNEFKHFLNFKKPAFGLIQITEPVKFDAAEFIVEQGENYARDVSLMAEEIPLEFYRGEHEKADAPYELPDGVIVDRLGMALDLLLQADREFGFEAEVEYTLERNGLVFVPAELNFEKRETDERTYFNCSLVQNSQRALAKRRADIKIDGFATTDLDGNPTSPLATTNILLKAKPVSQISKWITTEPFNSNGFGFLDEASTDIVAYNTARSLIQSTLEDSFTPFFLTNDGRFFEYVRAKNDLSNLTITFSNLNGTIAFRVEGRTTSTLNIGGSLTLEIKVRIGADFFTPDEEFILPLASVSLDVPPPYEEPLIVTETFNVENNDYVINIPAVTAGKGIWIYIESTATTFGRNSGGFSEVISQYEMVITGTSTAVDSVIKGVPYISLLKKAIKDTNGFDVAVNDFDTGQKYGNLYAFSGNLIRQRDDVPFYFTLKDRIENLLFRNYDVQMNSSDAFCLHYRDFYADVDNGGFLMPTSENFKSSTYNEKYAINSLEYQYKTYEKDRDEENTLDGVHTKTQWLINNTKVTAVKKVDVEDIFDPFSIEAQRRLALKETTALENDNKVFVVDTITLSPTARGGFTRPLEHNFDGTTLKLLNDNSFNWGLLGFSINDTINILQGENIGEYTVTAFEASLITLEFVSGVLNFEGSALTQIDFAFTNVLLTNRTSEGFSLIENLSSGDNFSNLAYTIRRNLVDWEEYISTCADFITQDVSNTEFINNGELTTQLEGGIVYKENADIVLTEIAPAILTPRIYEAEIIVEYNDMLDLIQKYESLSTVGGFLRVQDANGRIKKLYPKSFKYMWMTKVLNIVGEERKESDLVEITKASGVITINRVGYPKEVLPTIFWEINNEYIVLFDINQINLINFTKFDNVKVNGVIYDTVEGLGQAMSAL